MDKKLGSRIAGGNTAYKRSTSDFYPTPPEVTYALLDFLKIEKNVKIWECACGAGHMLNAIREAGYDVIGTDLLFGQDYLTADTPENVGYIITNPPFSKAEDFIRKSLERGLPFAFLLKAQFWHARRRYSLFFERPPAWVLPLTWRPDFLFGTRGGGSPLMDVMWCVWEPGETETRYRPLERPGKRMNDGT